MKSIDLKYRGFALFMATLMFLTSSGLSVDLHFCQGQLKSFSFFGKAPTCHEQAAAANSCPHHKKLAAQNKAWQQETNNCCNNEVFYFQIDQDEQILPSRIEAHSLFSGLILSAPVPFIENSLIEQEQTAIKHYKPPLIPRNIPVLHQSFLL